MNENLKEKIVDLEKLSRQFSELASLSEALKDYSMKWDGKVFNKKVVAGLQEFTREFIYNNCPAIKDSNYRQWYKGDNNYDKLSVYWCIDSLGFLE